jgi:hypothetical protein
LEGAAVDEEVRDEFADVIERYRMAGQDLEVDGPIYVPGDRTGGPASNRLLLEDVQSALLEIFSNQVRSQRNLGRLSPGQLYLWPARLIRVP